MLSRLGRREPYSEGASQMGGDILRPFELSSSRVRTRSGWTFKAQRLLSPTLSLAAPDEYGSTGHNACQDYPGH